MSRTMKSNIKDHYLINCPGCKSTHILDKRWTFNGDFDHPTFSPSLNCSWGPMPEGHPKASQIERCHSFITNGRIQFLGDCTHFLVNQTVDLPEFTEIQIRIEGINAT